MPGVTAILGFGGSVPLAQLGDLIGKWWGKVITESTSDGLLYPSTASSQDKYRIGKRNRPPIQSQVVPG